jgi:hypothetical protein
MEEVITRRQIAALAREAHLAETGAKLSALLRQEGASLGGARPKMRLCILPNGSLCGTVNSPNKAEHWILKFDNAKHPGDARVEYAYSLMARAAGIEMPATQLIEGETADGRQEHHFAVKRFDRVGAHGKIHFHSLAGLLNVPIHGRYGDYEEILGTVMQLGCPATDVEQVIRRCAFNRLACNRDDHYKNFAFLHHPATSWRFSPAYDLTYTDKNLRWVRELGRASKLFGKIDFTVDDVMQLGRLGNLSATKGKKNNRRNTRHGFIMASICRTSRRQCRRKSPHLSGADCCRRRLRLGVKRCTFSTKDYGNANILNCNCTILPQNLCTTATNLLATMLCLSFSRKLNYVYVFRKRSFLCKFMLSEFQRGAVFFYRAHGTRKAECFGSSVPASRKEAVLMIVDYSEGFDNNRRVHSARSYQSPLAVEQQLRHNMNN